MVHGLDNVGTASEAVSAKADAAGFERFMAPVNYIVMIVSSLALVVASFVLTYSVASRYFFHFSTDWQDEFSVFLIVGAVFMSAAAVQARRGHVAIEAIVRHAVAARKPHPAVPRRRRNAASSAPFCLEVLDPAA